jgi:hypothetical protein
MPASLSEELLLAFARDFRAAVNAMWGPLVQGTEAEGMPVALCVVLHVLAEHPAGASAPEPVNASWEELSQAIELYQRNVESEVLTRIVGLPTCSISEHAFEELREKLNRRARSRHRSRRRT